METANLFVALGGDKRNTVPKYDVTAAEAAVLRLIHGDDAVFDIEIVGTVSRTHRQEIGRLTRDYGRRDGERYVSPAVSTLYPGAAARVFEAYEELEFPEESYKAERRAPRRAPNVAKPVEAAPVESPAPVDYNAMTVNELRAAAERDGVDLTGVTRKADIVEALELRDRNATGETDDDGVEEMDDGLFN